MGRHRQQNQIAFVKKRRKISSLSSTIISAHLMTGN
jgi:hypothetical protein